MPITPEQPFNPRGATVVERVTHELREVALSSAEGAYLGSDERLTAHYGVSSPTLRQAARLLEHEGVLKVKRGVHGGYYAARPKIEAITRVGAIFLRTKPTALDDIVKVLDALTPLIVTSVIQSDRLPEMEEIVRLAAAEDESGSGSENRNNLQARFVSLLMDLTENSIIQLVHSVTYQFGLTVRTHRLPSDGELVQALRDATVATAKALLDKDAAAATAHAMEHRRLIAQGIRRSLPTPTATTGDAAAGR